MQDGYRGQTEPLAAVIAVAALAVGLSLYAVTSEEFVAELGSEETNEEADLEAVWQSLSEDGVIRTDRQSASNALAGEPFTESICITLLVINHNGNQSVSEQLIVTDGGETRDAIEHPECRLSTTALDTHIQPHSLDGVSRTVPVQMAPGEIRPGLLHIEVLP